ncbi:alpha/beta fold hydrolase [Paramagnetospirillum kuznetsovii]|nr:alpha/beta hydrolase [Paramagnetospirillum kuznetsovii]
MTSPILSRRALLTAGSVLTVAACAGPMVGGADGLGHARRGRGAEPVVVLHEWLGDHVNYDPVLPYLSEDRYTYTFADLRGYGWSKGMAGQYSVKEAAADVLALMDRYGHARFHVVGHSMSGMIAQYLALIARERVISVVAISPVPASGFKTDEAGLKRLIAVIDDDAAARAAMEARTAKRYEAAWLDRKLGIARQAATRDSMLGYLGMFTGTDFSAEAKGLPTPLTAIVGEHDIPLYREDSVRKLFAPLYPNFAVSADREAGHYAMLETPVLLAALVERALANPPGGKG